MYCFVLSCVVLCRVVLFCTVWHIVRVNLKAPQFLKIERYAQRLSHRVCMGNGGSGDGPLIFHNHALINTYFTAHILIPDDRSSTRSVCVIKTDYKILRK